jgi:hypothetical protein
MRKRRIRPMDKLPTAADRIQTDSGKDAAYRLKEKLKAKGLKSRLRLASEEAHYSIPTHAELNEYEIRLLDPPSGPEWNDYSVHITAGGGGGPASNGGNGGPAGGGGTSTPFDGMHILPNGLHVSNELLEDMQASFANVSEAGAGLSSALQDTSKALSLFGMQVHTSNLLGDNEMLIMPPSPSLLDRLKKIVGSK